MAQVFLSYARDDVGRAKALAAAIERDGFSVWWDRDLEGGAEYSREIDEALKAADVVVVLWSKVSVGSAWVRDEAAAGRDSGRLVPARLDDSEPPLGFRQYQTIDLSRWNGRSDSAGVKTLKRAIAAKVGRGSPAAAPAPDLQDRRKDLPRWAVPLAALFLLVAVALGYLWYTRSGDSGGPTIAIVSAPTGADPARSEALARSLSVEVGAMQSGATNAFELQETAGASPDDVDYLVQVAASPVGPTARADLSLLAGRGRQILWTGHFEKPAANEDELRLQSATRLAAVLSCLTEATTVSAGGIDQSTLKLYLRGCERYRDEVGNVADAAQLSLFREVVERAPHFGPALAHLGLIEADAEQEKEARQHIAGARRIDPSLAKIYLAEVSLTPRWQWSRRQAILAEGLKLNSNSAELHNAMAFEFSQVGRRAEGLDSARRARALDPFSPIIRANFIQHLFNGGHRTEAEKEFRIAESIWPDSATLRETRYGFDLRIGDAANALRMAQADASKAFTLGSTVRVRNPGPERFLQARIDPTPQNINAAVDAYMNRFRKDPADAGSMTLSLVGLGKVDEVFEAYANPVAVKSMMNHTNTFFRPYMKPFLHDPRFMRLAARLGLVRYWTEAGKWPDFCLDDDLPYDCKAEAAKYR